MNSFRVVRFILYKTIKVPQMPVIQAFVTLFICYIIFYSKEKRNLSDLENDLYYQKQNLAKEVNS
ncbi:UNVERIFIED_ORG: hypothetical protein ABIC81_001100 [Bacillus proteolyticus]